MKNNNKLLLLIGIALFAVFLVYLSSSFYQIIASSIILAYLINPFKKKISTKVSDDNLACFLSMLIGSLILLIFMSIILISLFNSASGIKDILAKGEDFEIAFMSINLLKNINLNEVLTTAGLNQFLNIVQLIILVVPNLLINAIIFLVLLFYFIKYWDDIIYIIRGVIPPGEIRYFDVFFSKVDLVMKSIFQAQFLTALIQTSLVFAALLLLQVPYAFELSLFTFIMGFLSITSMLVPLGLNVYYFYEGVVTGNFIIFFLTVGFSLLIFVIDDFIKPIISKKVANTNPVIFFLGIFGGVATLGFTGFVIGPIITTSFQTLFEIAYDDKI